MSTSTTVTGGDVNNPLNQTTKIPSEIGWAWESLPPILGRLDYAPSRALMLARVDDLKENGIVVLDSDGNPIRDFTFLPRHLSSNLEWFRYEAYFRMDPRLKYVDLWARMPVGTRKFDDKRVRQTSNMRMRKVRKPYLVQCWDHKGPESPRALVELVEALSETQINLNTTWQITSQSIRQPGGSTYLALDYFLEPGVHQHTPSMAVQAAQTRLQLLQSLATSQNVPHWTDLHTSLLPSEWFCRARKDKRSQNLDIHSSSLTDSQIDTSDGKSSRPVTDLPDSKPLPRKRKRADENSVATASTCRKRGTKSSVSRTLSTAESGLENGDTENDFAGLGRSRSTADHERRLTKVETQSGNIPDRPLEDEHSYEARIPKIQHQYPRDTMNASNAVFGRRASDFGPSTIPYDMFSSNHAQAFDYSQTTFHHHYTEQSTWTTFDSNVDDINNNPARPFAARPTSNVLDNNTHNLNNSLTLLPTQHQSFSGRHMGRSLPATPYITRNTHFPGQTNFRRPVNHLNSSPYSTNPTSHFDPPPNPTYHTQPRVRPTTYFDPAPRPAYQNSVPAPQTPTDLPTTGLQPLTPCSSSYFTIPPTAHPSQTLPLAAHTAHEPSIALQPRPGTGDGIFLPTYPDDWMQESLLKGEIVAGQTGLLFLPGEKGKGLDEM